MWLRRKRRTFLVCLAVITLCGVFYSVTVRQSSVEPESLNQPGHIVEKADEGLKHFSKLLDDYAVHHKAWAKSVSVEGKNSKTVLMYRCSGIKCGSIGDQIYGIVTTFLLAVLSDRIFIINYGTGGEGSGGLKRYLAVNKIDWSISLPATDVQEFALLEGSKDLHDISRKTMNALLSPKVQYVSLTTTLKPDDLFSPFFDQDLLEKLLVLKGDETSLESLRDLLWEHRWLFMNTAVSFLFHFSQEVMQRAGEIQKDTNVFGMYSAVHVRTGLGMGDDDMLHHRLNRLGMSREDTWDFILKCSKSVSEKKVGHALALYVASDSHKVKDWITEKRIDHAVFYDIFLNSESDQSQNSQLVEANVNKAMLDAWAELFILSRARILLLSPLSKFSEVAVYLRNTHFNNEYVYTFPYHEEC